jgi:hypothetical protein
MQVLMLSKKQWFEPRRMGSLWFGGVLLFVCVQLAAAESGQGSALRTENTAGGRFQLWRVDFINGPRQNWNTKATGSRSSTQCLSCALPASILDSQGAIVPFSRVVRIFSELN